MTPRQMDVSEFGGGGRLPARPTGRPLWSLTCTDDEQGNLQQRNFTRRWAASLMEFHRLGWLSMNFDASSRWRRIVPPRSDFTTTS